LTRPRPFYGWFVVAALSVAGGFTMAMGIGNFGVFIDPMSQDLGIGQAAFGWALAARLVGFAAAGPIIGRLVDRFGARGPLSIAIAIYSLSVVALGSVTTSWQLIGLLLFSGVLGFWGSNTLYFTVLASQWFIRRRGKAMSVMFVGFPLGIAISIPITQVLVDEFGWRTAWVILGLTGGGSVLLITRLVLRNRPEDMGLQPDGLPTPRSVPTAERTFVDEHSWTLHDAVRTGAFWRLAVAFGTVMLGMSAIGLFWIPYFIDEGFQPHLAAWALSAYALSQACSSLLLAPFIDRFQPRFLAMFGFASFVVAFLLMMNVSATWQMFLAGLLGGAGVGSGMLLNAQLWPAYFGRRNIGAIRGAALLLTITFSGLGTAATGMIFDATGSYAPAWWTAIAFLIAGALLLAATPKPQPVALTTPPQA
jgi:MFS family permease